MNLSRNSTLRFSNGILFLMLAVTGCMQTNRPDKDRNNTKSEVIEVVSLDTFSFNSNIRALEVVNDSTIWFAGSNGVFGYTLDAGQSWKTDSVRWNSEMPEFRAIAVVKEAVFLMNIGSPARIIKSTDFGKHWETVFEALDSNAFYDAMAFWNENEGIAIGDPLSGCLSVVITKDGGATWETVPCAQLPASVEGEAAFAASNSNISIVGNQAWVATGGKRSRVLYTPDRGNSWSVQPTEIIQGSEGEGIYSIDFMTQKEDMPSVEIGKSQMEMSKIRSKRTMEACSGKAALTEKTRDIPPVYSTFRAAMPTDW